MYGLEYFMFVLQGMLCVCFLNYVCFTHFDLFDVAKGEEKKWVF